VKELVRLDSPRRKSSEGRESGQEHENDFPVLQSDGNTVWASSISTVVKNLPPIVFEYVFVAPEIRDKAKAWIEKNKDDILQQLPKEEDQ
jgi:hypothetical protein